MSRVQFISHGGKRILYFDFSGCKSAEVAEVVEEAKAVLVTEPPGSVLARTNVTDTEMSKATSASMKEFTTHNTPYVRASPVTGVDGLKKIVYNAVMTISGRHISAFDTLEQAKDWLASR